MKTLTLKNKFQTNATLLPNDFIDNYMAGANGEFVKVYLFLLRHLDDPCSSITISTIADCLNNTENDILRAFRYWEGQGLLRTERDADGKIICLELLKNAAQSPSDDTPASDSTPASVSASAALQEIRRDAPRKVAEIDQFRAQKEIRSLLFIAEQYLGKTLTHSEMDAITYFYDTLHMSADLIEYLLESCVESGHKSMHYIQKVAFSWAESGIETVAQAREESMLYSRSCYTVLNAFGIKNRGPAASEMDYIRKWTEEYAFAPDLIEEACRRTIMATHQPSFEYADSILGKWHDRDIRSLNDVARLDEEYQKDRAGAARRPGRPATKNHNNFERRSYDMDSLEEKLLNSN